MEDEVVARNTFNVLTIFGQPDILSDDREKVVNYQVDTENYFYLNPSNRQTQNMFYMKSTLRSLDNPYDIMEFGELEKYFFENSRTQ